MKKLLIALMTIGLLGATPLALADRDRDESGFKKVHDRHDGFLKKKVRREHHGYRDRDHRHEYRHPGRHKGKQWHQGGHDRRYDGGHRGRDGYRKHHRHSRDYDRRSSFFGIADGQRGVLIWRD